MIIWVAEFGVLGWSGVGWKLVFHPISATNTKLKGMVNAVE